MESISDDDSFHSIDSPMSESSVPGSTMVLTRETISSLDWATLAIDI
jgi:hypothetical protein